MALPLEGIKVIDFTGVQAVPTDTIAPYNGPIGPDNSLYGLKIAFENLDESFTFNQSEKLDKQVSHADIRLTELKRELAENRTGAAEVALEQYWQKMNQTKDTLSPFLTNDNGIQQAVNDTGLLHAQDMIAKHQQILEDLMQAHPDNKGLARAYNNSIALEQKFAEKIKARQLHQQEGGNGTFVPDGNGRFGQNVTPPYTGVWSGQDGNRTMPHDGNQSWNRNGQDGNRNDGNTTGNFPRDMNQTINIHGNGNRPDGQAANQTTQGQHQQPGNGVPDNSQNSNGNTGNQNNNNGNSVNGGNHQNNNAVTNMPTRNNNNNGNSGTTGAGNNNGNMKPVGR
jgi:hypothetical protein